MTDDLRNRDPYLAGLVRIINGQNLPQRQDSTTDQLQDLLTLAKALKMYDAAEVLSFKLQDIADG